MMPSEGDQLETWPRVLLGATLVLILAVGLFPFQFGTDPRHPLSADLISAGETIPGAVRDVLANLLLFVPLGLSVSVLAKQRHLPGVARFLVVLTAGLALSLTVEAMQTLLPSRDPTLRDVTVNTAGALLGMLPERHWEGHALTVWDRGRRAAGGLWVIRRPGAALAIHVTLVFLAAALLQTRTQLSNWEQGFPLLIGNEATADRPWSGHLLGLEIADRALPPGQVEAAFRESLSVLLGPLVASFHFADGRPGPEDGAAGLVWRRAASPARAAIPGTGLWLSGAQWLESKDAGRRISEALRRTNQMTVKLVCSSAGPGQDGPARLVSISADPYHRNFMVGQEGADLVARLRTPLTGPNGRSPELLKPGVFAMTTQRTILLTYDGAVLTVFVDSARDPARMDLSPGAVLIGALVEPSASDLPGYRFAFIALAAAPAGFLAALAAARQGLVRMARLLPLGGFAVLLAGGLECVLVLVSGRFFELGPVLTGVLLCSGGGLCAIYLE